MKASDGGSDNVAPRVGDVAGDGSNGSSSSGWGSPAADGGPMPIAMPEPEPALPFSADSVPCLRGPCRYYFAAQSHFDHGNPAGTFAPGKEPRARHHACKAIPGVWLELSSDSPVYACNSWDPLDRGLVLARDLRREDYLKANPEHAMQQRIGDDLDELDDEEEGEEQEEDLTPEPAPEFDTVTVEVKESAGGYAQAPRPHEHVAPELSKVQRILLEAADAGRLSLPCTECGQYIEVTKEQA